MTAILIYMLGALVMLELIARGPNARAAARRHPNSLVITLLLWPAYLVLALLMLRDHARGDIDLEADDDF